jgi:hypothetical protein
MKKNSAIEKERMTMNNKTVHNFTIKLREDRAYDLYIDCMWVLSRGGHENILEELKKIMDAEL